MGNKAFNVAIADWMIQIFGKKSITLNDPHEVVGYLVLRNQVIVSEKFLETVHGFE
jgi:hypothetical protein